VWLDCAEVNGVCVRACLCGSQTNPSPASGDDCTESEGSCLNCPAGRYGRSSACTDCPLGRYSLGHAEGCKDTELDAGSKAALLNKPLLGGSFVKPMDWEGSTDPCYPEPWSRVRCQFDPKSKTSLVSYVTHAAAPLPHCTARTRPRALPE
jgi:hypothetical protein